MSNEIKDSPVSRLQPTEHLLSDDLMLVSKHLHDEAYSSNKITVKDTVSSFIQMMGSSLSALAEQYLSSFGSRITMKKWEWEGDWNVDFYDNGELKKHCRVYDGEDAIPPSLTKEGFTLTWDKPYTNIREDTNCSAIWI